MEIAQTDLAIPGVGAPPHPNPRWQIGSQNYRLYSELVFHYQNKRPSASEVSLSELKRVMPDCTGFTRRVDNVRKWVRRSGWDVKNRMEGRARGKQTRSWYRLTAPNDLPHPKDK